MACHGRCFLADDFGGPVALVEFPPQPVASRVAINNWLVVSILLIFPDILTNAWVVDDFFHRA